MIDWLEGLNRWEMIGLVLVVWAAASLVAGPVAGLFMKVGRGPDNRRYDD